MSRIKTMKIGDRIATVYIDMLSGDYHRENLPAIIEHDRHGNIIRECYYINGELHRDDGPAFIEYYDNGNIRCEYYYIEGKMHCENGPANIFYDENGNLESFCYGLFGIKVSLVKVNKKLIDFAKNKKDLFLLKLSLTEHKDKYNNYNELFDIIESKLVMFKLLE